MGLRLGDTVPNFRALTTIGEIEFYDYIDQNWALLFSHPADYTPVCTTELGYTAKLKSEFEERGVKVLALSIDKLEEHHGWIKDINSTQQTNVEFPIIADTDMQVSLLYDMIHPNASGTHTVRSVFIIGPDKKLKLTLTYPASTGRNFNEIIRVIDSLQLTDQYSVATPANWENGQDVIVSNTIKTEDILSKFPKGYTEIKPYLRTTPQPNI